MIRFNGSFSIKVSCTITGEATLPFSIFDDISNGGGGGGGGGVWGGGGWGGGGANT